MEHVIKLLPDRIANQIAAGEVVQRPASVVKELLENAIDADANHITLIIKEAGKELIQVIDNGKGMNPVDARMCFERHATSKISTTDDLMSIRTMGFRGEAMASIAAVAQVVMQTKPHDAEVGTEMHIDGSIVKYQQPVGCVEGTNISVRNLFFNIPARRKFLKSNTVELRHIIEEFSRIALAYPNLTFKLIHNNTEQFNLRSGSLKTRILELLGGRYDKQLLDVSEHTDYVKIYGFIGKPEAALKTRGNQFFFINNRFIRSPYLQHAIIQAYQNLIAKEEFPFFALFFEIDPSRVDVNVHPTKQEVKFEDEQILYSFLLSAVKHTLGRYNIMPSLDFHLDANIQSLSSVQQPFTPKLQQDASQGFAAHSFSKSQAAHFIDNSKSRNEWEQQRNAFFDIPIPSAANRRTEDENNISTNPLFSEDNIIMDQINSNGNVILWNQYAVTTTKNEVLFIHIQRAVERITFDEMLKEYETDHASSQQLLFPEMIELSPVNAISLRAIIPDLKRIGYDISEMGTNAFAINGHPQLMDTSIVTETLHEILDIFQITQSVENSITSIHKILKTMAKRISNRWQPNMESTPLLVGRLFSSTNPSYTPDGARIISNTKLAEIDLLF